MNPVSTFQSFYHLWLYLKRLDRYDFVALYQSLNIKLRDEYAVQNRYLNRGGQYVKRFGLLGLSFETLIGRRISEAELDRIVLLAHFGPVYDDLFDRLNTPKKRMEELICNPEGLDPRNDEEEFFLSFYIPVCHEQKTNKDFFFYFNELTGAQEQSKKQVSGNLSFEEVDQVTRDKGGFSCLLVRSLLDKPMDENEKEGLYLLGALSQYMDDIFDWYDDLAEKRTTIANQLSLVELSKLYHSKFWLLQQSNLSKSFKQLAEVLLTPGLICLDLYKKEEIDTKKLSEERVILDMEKPITQWKLLWKVLSS